VTSGRLLALLRVAALPKQIASGTKAENWWDQRIPGTIIRVVELMVGAVGVAAAWFAIQGLDTANMQTRLAQEALADQRESSAWQILALPSLSGTGKQYALQALAAVGADMIGADLSCNTMAGLVPGADCTGGIDIAGVQMHSPPGDPSVVRRSDFSGATATDSQFSNLQFESVNFTGVDLYSSDWQDVEWTYMRFNDVNFRRSTLKNVDMWAVDFTGADLTLADFSNITYEPIRNVTPTRTINISGVRFCRVSMTDLGLTHDIMSSELETMNICTTGLDQAFFDRAWFYADSPPQFLYPSGGAMGDMLILPGCDAGGYFHENLGNIGVWEFTSFQAPTGCDEGTPIAIKDFVANR
jgi:uncharacterized protein YjbI with pentapeptide repeats